MNLGNPSGCVQQDARECVGQINTNYIYQLIESKFAGFQVIYRRRMFRFMKVQQCQGDGHDF